MNASIKPLISTSDLDKIEVRMKPSSGLGD
jgi:hypothetical protein